MKDFETLDEAFPQCVHGITPLGARVLLQLKSVKKASKGGIILIHDGVQQTINILPRLIATLQQRGYRFVTIDEMMKAK